MSDVYELLDGLDEADKRVLYDRLAYQFDRKHGPSVVDLQMGADYVYGFQALLAVTHEQRNMDKFVRGYGRANFVRDMDALNSYVTRASGKLAAAQRNALTFEVLMCLVKEVKLWNSYRGNSLAGRAPHQHELTPEHILTLVRGHLAPAVERCYPGYASAGLLDKVVQMSIAA